MNVVLIGPHGAGKTTLGHVLAAELRWPFHDEIGRRLAADPRRRPAGLSAESPQSAFDLTVLTEEIARDLQHAAEHDGPRIVETWHPGNVAYAARRSPAVACAMLGHAHAAIDWDRVLVVPVTAPDHVLRGRRSEPGSHAFFAAVASDALALAGALGAHAGPAVSMHERTPQEVAQVLAPQLRAVVARLGARPTSCEPRT